jgi:lambda repressor-like predicted transcriptional regulator
MGSNGAGPVSSIAHLTAKVARKAEAERRARRELVAAMREARAQGASLRALASQSQLSHETVRTLTGPEA